VTVAAFGAGLLAPWAAGVPAPRAFGLSLCALAGACAALAALPGPRARVRVLECGQRGWIARLADGRDVPVRILPGTRILPRAALCRLHVEGRRLGLTVPAYSLPADEFRRLKGALRASASAAPC